MVQCEGKNSVAAKNSFTGLEDLDDAVEINTPWKTIGATFETKRV
jgi:hypothetical protein